MLELIRVLTSAGEGSRKSDTNLPTETSSNNVGSTLKKNNNDVSRSAEIEPQTNLGNDIQTYLDEKGRLRVSRVRAMGIRMTRDIQRNLDMIKEIEQERGVATENASNECTTGRSEGEAFANTPNGISILGDFDQDADGITWTNKKNKEGTLNVGTSIEISFETNSVPEFGGDDDDDLFAHLVAGDPVLDFHVDNSVSKKKSSDSASECEWEGDTLDDDTKADSELLVPDEMNDDSELEWEEGGDFVVDAKVKNSTVDINHAKELEGDAGGVIGNDVKVDSKSLVSVGDLNDESEFEWKVGSSDMQEEGSSCPSEYKKIASKGALEEEADFQEAIRRSLQDLEDGKTLNDLHKHEKARDAAEMSIRGMDIGFLDKDDPSKTEVSQNPVPDHAKRIRGSLKGEISEINNPLEVQLSPLSGNCDKMEIVTEKTCHSNLNEKVLKHGASEERNIQREVLIETISKVQEKDVCQISHQQKHTSNSGNDGYFQ